MKGSTTKYRQKNNRISWGYHFRPAKDANGKWIRVCKQGFETRREAEVELESAIKQYKAGIPIKASAGETFAEFFTFWLKEYAKRHCQPKTVERYEELGAY